jgi:hypothetical protein
MNPETTPVTDYSQPGGKTGAGPVPHDHVYEDYKASSAIAGMPPGEASDKARFLEKEWTDWVDDHAKDPILGTAREPFRILRLQVRELAMAYSTEVAGKRALGIQADIGRMHIQTQQQHSEFRRFLGQHFETDLESGVARNVTLFQIAQEIMIRNKPKWFEFWRR